MRKKAGKARHGLRWGIFTLAAALATVSVSADPADARGKRKRGKAVASSYSPPYADIVVDANSGAILHSTAADAPRHPASLTKIMTLYMLFEQLEAGKLTMHSELPVSGHAASQAPSKLNVKPGQTISVEDAIKATVTKSANDVAVVIAEAIGDDEPTFGRMMTAKARALGMQNTVYRNASGLPDEAQITTARDQAILGRAIQDRFPKYYAYFSTTRFFFRGRPIGNHNRLLGKVEGVDGIKTGYTNASGFNLVTSMKRGGRHVVAVVLGGRSGASRDQKMRVLISDYIQVAAARRTAPVIAEGPAAEPKRTIAQRLASAVITPARAEPSPMAAAVPIPRPAPAPAPVQVASAMPMPAVPVIAPPATVPVAAPGSNDPLEPIAVKTVTVRRGIENVFLGSPPATVSVAPSVPSKHQQLAFADPMQDRQPGILGSITAKPAPQPAPVVQAAPVQIAHAGVTTAPEMARRPVRSGWIIQVGAFDTENDARHRLGDAVARAKPLLGDASGFTERVAKGDKTLYRARFAGLEKEQAEAACQHLKKNEIACMALKN